MKVKSRRKLSGVLAFLTAFSMLATACNDSEKTKKTDVKTTVTTTVGTTENGNTNGENTDYTQIFSKDDDETLKLCNLDFEIYAVSPVYNNKAVYDSGLNEDFTIDFALADFEKGVITYKNYQTNFTLDDCYYRFFVTDYGVVFLDIANAEIVTFDENLNEISKTDLDEELVYAENVGYANTVLLRQYGTKDVTCVTVNSQNSVDVKNYTVQVDDPDRLVLDGVTDDKKVIAIYYSQDYTSESYMLVDLENNTNDNLNVSENSYVSNTENAYVSVNSSLNEVDVFPKEDTNIRRSFNYKSGLDYYCADENNAYFWWDNYNYTDQSEQNSVGITVYSLENGKPKATFTQYVEDFGYFNWVCAFGDKYLVCVNCDNETFTYIWSPKQTEITQGSCGGILGENPTTQNEEIIERIQTKYGINIYTKNEAVKYFYGYAVVSENNDSRINNALVEIEKFLQKVPDKMTEEMVTAGNYNGFNVCLTGRIVPDTEGDSINDAAAFCTIKDNSHYIVMDVTMPQIGQSFSHEFMHAIENSMSSMAVYKNADLDVFDDWFYLNPVDFYYAYGYTDGDGNTMFGENYQQYLGSFYNDGDDLENIYFVDGYSTNYPNEDRARIFENLATYTSDTLPAFFKSEHIKLKAEYLCACIREAFDCITDDATLFWEQSLDPEHDLEYFYQLFALGNTNGVG